MSAAAKAHMRRQIKNAISLLSHSQIRSQSESVTASVLSLPQYKNARSLSIYLAMLHGEIVTNEIIRHAFKDGKRLFIPWLHKRDDQRTSMDMVKLDSFEEFEQLPRDKWGIPTIADDVARERAHVLRRSAEQNEIIDLDMMILPGLGFDGAGRRLGHGKGYYDRFLDSYRDQRLYSSSSGAVPPVTHSPEMPFLVGLALEAQFMNDVPVTSHDWLVDVVLVGTDSKITEQSFRS